MHLCNLTDITEQFFICACNVTGIFTVENSDFGIHTIAVEEPEEEPKIGKYYFAIFLYIGFTGCFIFALQFVIIIEKRKPKLDEIKQQEILAIQNNVSSSQFIGMGDNTLDDPSIVLQSSGTKVAPLPNPQQILNQTSKICSRKLSQMEYIIVSCLVTGPFCKNHQYFSNIALITINFCSGLFIFSTAGMFQRSASESSDDQWFESDDKGIALEDLLVGLVVGIIGHFMRMGLTVLYIYKKKTNLFHILFMLSALAYSIVAIIITYGDMKELYFFHWVYQGLIGYLIFVLGYDPVVQYFLYYCIDPTIDEVKQHQHIPNMNVREAIRTVQTDVQVSSRQKESFKGAATAIEDYAPQNSSSQKRRQSKQKQLNVKQQPKDKWAYQVEEEQSNAQKGQLQGLKNNLKRGFIPGLPKAIED